MKDCLRLLSLAAALAVICLVPTLEARARPPAAPTLPPSTPEPAARPEPRSRSAAIKEVLPSSVRIAVFADGKQLRSASGVVLGGKGAGKERIGWVITNAHVVDAGSSKATVEILVDRDGETVRLPGKVLASGRVPETDLALLEVPGLDAEPARLVAEQEVELGDDVIAVGAPFGRSLSVSSGIVSQLELDEAGLATSMKTDAPIGYGASGGGIFRVSDGKLIAVVEGYRTVKVSFPVDGKSYSFDVPMPGETFAAPAAKIRRFLSENGHAHLVGGEGAGRAVAGG